MSINMSKIKVLITAGGTSEKLDEVRKITNTSTGQLGALIAGSFIKKAHAEVTYVCGETAITPSMEIFDKITVSSVSDLMNKLACLFSQNKYDAVIHSMAVSDYSVQGITSAGKLSDILAKAIIDKKDEYIQDVSKLTEIIKNTMLQSSENDYSPKKISSNIENPILILNKTPKVISLIKKAQPETVLVGFKLLAGVSNCELERIGYELLLKNNCDFVLANDSEKILGDTHEGILISADNTHKRLHTKQEIAAQIADSVITKIGLT